MGKTKRGNPTGNKRKTVGAEIQPETTKAKCGQWGKSPAASTAGWPLRSSSKMVNKDSRRVLINEVSDNQAEQPHEEEEIDYGENNSNSITHPSVDFRTVGLGALRSDCN